MKLLLQRVRSTPLLWLLIFVPVALVAAKQAPESHNLLFVLSVLAIVPLAALLGHGGRFSPRQAKAQQFRKFFAAWIGFIALQSAGPALNAGLVY